MLHCYYGGKELTLFQYSTTPLSNSIYMHDSYDFYMTGVAAKNILYSPKSTMRVVSEGTTLAYRADNQTLYVPTSGVETIPNWGSVDVRYTYKQTDYAYEYELTLKNLKLVINYVGTNTLKTINKTNVDYLLGSSDESYGIKFPSFVSLLAGTDSSTENLTNKTYTVPFTFLINDKYTTTINMSLKIPSMDKDTTQTIYF